MATTKPQPKVYTEKEMQDALYKATNILWTLIPDSEKIKMGSLSGWLIPFYNKSIRKTDGTTNQHS